MIRFDNRTSRDRRMTGGTRLGDVLASRAERRSGVLVRDEPRPIAWQRATKGSLVHGNVFWGRAAQKE